MALEVAVQDQTFGLMVGAIGGAHGSPREIKRGRAKDPTVPFRGFLQRTPP